MRFKTIQTTSLSLYFNFYFSSVKAKIENIRNKQGKNAVIVKSIDPNVGETNQITVRTETLLLEKKQ